MDNPTPKIITWLLTVAAAAILLSISGVSGRLAQLAQGGMTPAAPPAGAQYTECFAAKLWIGEGAAVSAGEIPRTMRVPPGWTVVGGTTANIGAMPLPAAVLCRTTQSVVAPPFPPKRAVPAGPAVAQGRCSVSEVDEMQQAGMSKSAIEQACKP